MADHLDALLDVLALHLAQRRDALDVIGRFGNRFEHWLKWEAAIAFHVASFTTMGTPIKLVAAERETCDVFVGGKPWLDGGAYPEQDDNDVWMELKARSTADAQGAGQLANEILSDHSKLSARKRSGAKGHFVSVALVIGHPRRGDAKKWVSKLVGHEWLTTFRASLPPPRERLLWQDAHDAPSADRLLAALLLWEI
jgi:hypothetical protein